MTQTRWGILGPGAISADFARALRHATRGALYAVGSSSPDRAAAFASEHGATVTGSYAEIVDRDDVDAVYIGTVHTTHADLAVAALAAGKAVLCEKPATAAAVDTDRVLDAAAAAGRPFLEAYKYRFGPLAASLRALVADGAIGRPLHAAASFGFSAPSRDGRLFDPAVGGGAILDTGGYPVSLAVGIAAWAGIGIAAPAVAQAGGEVAAVDETAVAGLVIGGMTADVSASIVAALGRGLYLRGTEGRIDVPDVWGSRSSSATTLTLRRGTREAEVVRHEPVDPMAAEADAVSLAIAEHRLEVPEMTWAETASVARVLDAWRARLQP
ncbi:Gfo/Idh/MocA family protein [Microbacterium sp. P05]|uniref:Gfo/Idh/MocA family protein n=1 Tax=Microbacterium sp. P05 TaxID=3366948 RepID=UPI003745247E